MHSVYCCVVLGFQSHCWLVCPRWWSSLCWRVTTLWKKEMPCSSATRTLCPSYPPAAALHTSATLQLVSAHFTRFIQPMMMSCVFGVFLHLLDIQRVHLLKFSWHPSLSLLLCSELVGESVLSIQSSEKVTSISLPPTPPYHTLEFQLEVLCVIPSGADRPTNERLTNGEVRHRPRSYSHPDTPMTAIDQRVRSFK